MAEKFNVEKLLVTGITSAKSHETNPILTKRQMVYIMDGVEQGLYIGDGVKKLLELRKVGGNGAITGTGAPQSTLEADTGTIYVDITTGKEKVYVCAGKSGESTIWKQMVTPEELSDLGAGDMLKSQFATNSKVSAGYVDSAIKADKLTNKREIAFTGDATGAGQFDGTANLSIPLELSEVLSEEKTLYKVTVDKKGRVTGGETALSTSNLSDGNTLLHSTDTFIVDGGEL